MATRISRVTKPPSSASKLSPQDPNTTPYAPDPVAKPKDKDYSVGHLEALVTAEEWLNIVPHETLKTNFSEIRMVNNDQGEKLVVKIPLNRDDEFLKKILTREIVTLEELENRKLGNLSPTVFFSDRENPILVMKELQFFLHKLKTRL